MRPFICEIMDVNQQTRHLDVIADSYESAQANAEGLIEPGKVVSDIYDVERDEEGADYRVWRPADRRHSVLSE